MGDKLRLPLCGVAVFSSTDRLYDKKPTNLIYGVDDKPPLFTTVILGLQHACILFVAIVFPVVIICPSVCGFSYFDASKVAAEHLAGSLFYLVGLPL